MRVDRASPRPLRARVRRGIEVKLMRTGDSLLLQHPRTLSRAPLTGQLHFVKMGKKSNQARFPLVRPPPSLVSPSTTPTHLPLPHPQARIKKMIQADEEVGKVAAATPIVVCVSPSPFLLSRDPPPTSPWGWTDLPIGRNAQPRRSSSSSLASSTPASRTPSRAGARNSRPTACASPLAPFPPPSLPLLEQP